VGCLGQFRARWWVLERGGVGTGKQLRSGQWWRCESLTGEVLRPGFRLAPPLAYHNRPNSGKNTLGMVRPLLFSANYTLVANWGRNF
jgi:hypothetical protein